MDEELDYDENMEESAIEPGQKEDRSDDDKIDDDGKFPCAHSFVGQFVTDCFVFSCHSGCRRTGAGRGQFSGECWLSVAGIHQARFVKAIGDRYI